jgi:hypothetical protein
VSEKSEKKVGLLLCNAGEAPGLLAAVQGTVRPSWDGLKKLGFGAGQWRQWELQKQHHLPRYTGETLLLVCINCPSDPGESIPKPVSPHSSLGSANQALRTGDLR